ncbi:MAG: hypothetical protein GX352_04935 [Clostridiales bacterium]|nr:hypothetical protein [Clostridiales bacterium]
MHIECTNCQAIFDEEINTHCPKCHAPAQEPTASSCGGCCSRNGHTSAPHQTAHGLDSHTGCGGNCGCGASGGCCQV